MAFDLNVSKKRKEFDIRLCIFCHEKDDGSFVHNPKYSSVQNIIESSIRRCDSAVSDLLQNEGDPSPFKWHRNCYATYVNKQNIKRRENQLRTEQGSEDNNIPSSNTITTRSVIPKVDFGKCIICQNLSKKGVKKTFRISEVEPARKILNLCTARQDFVFVRLSTCSDEKDIFAADVLYHKLCLLEYFHEKENDTCAFANQQCSPLNVAFSKLILEIEEDLNEKCFEISYLTQRLNELCEGEEPAINNRITKKLLIKHYGESLFFSHPADQSKSPLVFKSCLKPSELVEKVRHMSEKYVNTDKLREDIKNNSFELNGYICNDSLIGEAFDKFKLSSSWESFFLLVVGKNQTISDDLKRKCISIYMDLHCLVNAGDFTPKHVAVAQCVHHYTRSKFLITLLNRLGHSISYTTLTKLDAQVCTHIVNSSKEEIPIPANIVRDTNLFIHGAIDNDDFNEETYDGKATTHVTAMVLYQPSNEGTTQYNVEKEKLPIPEVYSLGTEQIDCQILRKCPPISKKPQYFPKPIDISLTSHNEIGDLIWVISRLDLDCEGDDLIMPRKVLCPGWTPFNQAISTSDLPMTNVGFCTLFPAPPTTTDAVYTVMCNFLKINCQVGQTYSVLSCDMAVYLLAKLVQLQTTGFERLYIRIGTFHLAKNWLSIIGQYLLDSGFVDIIIETELYGENTIKSALRGVQYNRGIRVHKIVYEACRRLQLQQFFVEQLQKDELILPKDLIQKLQASIMNADEDAVAIFELIQEEHSNIFKAFSLFLDDNSKNNETFKYWSDYCKMVELLLDCVRADRDGNWDLHLNVVQRMVPYFLMFNHYHYARGCIMYLEDMSKLPQDVVTEFKKGNFSVKRQVGKFNSVATDHALEQSLIRSSKVQGGLIGLTSNQSAMRKWCLLYHHKADMSMRLLKFCDMNQDPTSDVNSMHKEWSSIRVEKDEKDVQKIVKFFLEHDNPFSESSTPLRNVVSGLVAPEDAASFLLTLTENGKIIYDKFKNDRMIKQIKSLYAPINRNPILSFTSDTKSAKSKKPSACNGGNPSEIIMLAAQRNFNMQELLKHELMAYPPSLATERGHLKKSVKSELVHAIESDYECSEPLNNVQKLENQVHIFDGMALIHQVPNAVVSKMENFEDLALNQMSQITKYLTQRNTSRVDIVYDRYNESSIKNIEHEIRSEGKSPLIVHIHSDLTKTPKQWPRYLAVPENKKKLVEYISNYILNHIHIPNGKLLTLAGCFSDANMCKCKDDTQTISSRPTLTCNHEEADTRIFLHAQDCLRDSSAHNIIIHSPDTDIFVLGVRFWRDLKEQGCTGLWLIVGTGEKRRGLKCHSVADFLGEKLSKVLPALHAITGCDTTSKVGTKKAAYKYATSHEEVFEILISLQPEIKKESLQKLELLYLHLTKKKGSTCDESRYIQFSTAPSAINELHKLSCTSDSFHLHVLRCIAQLYIWENSLNAIVEPIDLTKYGYFKDENNKFRPLLISLPAIPTSLVKPCTCKNCSKTTCGCYSHGTSCCSYCKCSDKCQNPFMTTSSDEEIDMDEQA